MLTRSWNPHKTGSDEWAAWELKRSERRMKHLCMRWRYDLMGWECEWHDYLRARARRIWLAGIKRRFLAWLRLR